ncbi:MAG: hypothetical protein JWQ27_1123 [Ferruginibacter sp.]|nr:hypothetical protein [Ferruginibacter sp.]
MNDHGERQINCWGCGEYLPRVGLVPTHDFLSLSAADSNYEVRKYKLGFDDLFIIWMAFLSGSIILNDNK